MSEQIKVVLTEDELPKQWYNLNADFAKPMPPPLGMDGNPIGPEALAPVFPMNLIEQEMCADRWVDIPDEIMGYYKIWRPTPLYRARRLEQALGTPAKIYYKNEGVSPAGSHKPNTAVAQVIDIVNHGFRILEPNQFLHGLKDILFPQGPLLKGDILAETIVHLQSPHL